MGHGGHRRALVLLTVLVLGALVAACVMKAHQAAAQDGPPPAAQSPAPQRQAPAPAAAADSASAPISVIIPPETFVHVDADDEPVEAMTNTGLRPTPGDRFFVERAAGVHAADQVTVALVLDRVRDADWTRPGRWHALARE